MGQKTAKNVIELMVCDDQQPVLSPQQNQALSLLLTGNSQTLTAKEIGVTVETVNRWLNHHPHFVAAYRRGVLAAQDAVDNALTELAQDAVETLSKLLQNRDPKVRLIAAKTVLSVRPSKPEFAAIAPAKVQSELKHKLAPPAFDFESLIG